MKCKKQKIGSSERKEVILNSEVETGNGVVEITFPDGSSRSVPKGISLLELLKDYGNISRPPVVAARVDNDIKELTSTVSKDCKLSFLDIADEDGMRIYRRSLHFILIKAVRSLFPERKVVIGHSISKGIFCEINGDSELTEEEVRQIEAKMRELVDARIPFIKHELSMREAEELLVRSGRLDRFHAVEHRNKQLVTIYSCGDMYDYFYGYMVPDTGYIKEFALMYYPPGLILMFPDRMNECMMPRFKEQKKLFSIFREYKKWVHILGVQNVGALNDIVKSDNICELIRISEALHEKKIAQIADMITHSQNKKRVVLISGPSSSGKTTFAHRLSIQLRVNGLKPVTISLDDYFVDREKTPKDEKGEYDYEALEAIDIPLFNQHLNELIKGLEIEMPVFNFVEGKRESSGKKLKIGDDNILLIEGIHGLNDRLTPSIPKKSKFKIYVSALTSMNIDDHNRIPTTDTRFIRRIVRDFQFRGCSAINTIKRWPSVRRGEEKNIFPFQEKADIMFNSSLIYELGVLKTLAEPLLAEIDASHPEYSEAKRLLQFLSYFLPIESREIPLNSILREFIGGSVFY